MSLKNRKFPIYIQLYTFKVLGFMNSFETRCLGVDDINFYSLFSMRAVKYGKEGSRITFLLRCIYQYELVLTTPN